MGRVVVALVLGWTLGIGTGVGALVVSGNWYEYLPVPSTGQGPGRDEVLRALGTGTSCEPFRIGESLWLKCPRLRPGAVGLNANPLDVVLLAAAGDEAREHAPTASARNVGSCWFWSFLVGLSVSH